ncbi:N-acetylglucosamine-6-phosphate deacetylase [Malacoplasma penetrans]|uniref:N-acetylglucosamine 6-P deacetylase n=1 Tax=Malacoplasma penetrans (strain HF-2) TaxID=272633 RepID=Q8EWM8_MALP2|nr:N-acetylglucosamine-6-phosphate deacetylase [Malacoplasma penetrans]RXY96972.1 N-acetylglucosamine-6-phosphate deacetylase [Malacoplasma penetrans]BAC43966.1 N-acetylglucosamine 6-P deacetylase [Malacoplasma penetrans HF-2]
MKLLFKNAEIVLFDKNISGSLLTEDKIIKTIGDTDSTYNYEIDCKDLKIFPGFIDSHVHGGYGFDFEQNSIESYKDFASNIVKEGVTKFVLASVTSTPDKISSCLKTFSQFYNQQELTSSKCLGVHLEGPFISKEKKGAHKESLIIKPNIDLVKQWIQDSNNLIKIITFDIEHDEDSQFLKFLNDNNIIGSIGHSNISNKTFKSKTKDVPFYRVTHLFNGMSGLLHNNPGVAAAALNDDRVLCELICDGFHVDKDLIRITYLCKGSKKITLITDAMSAKGMDNGNYMLGELEVEKKDEICVLKNTSTLAGSVCTYSKCFKNFHDWINPTDQELAHVSSYNSAIQLGLKNTGLIKEDYLADLVLVNNDYEVVMTVCEGIITYIDNKYKNRLIKKG